MVGNTDSYQTFAVEGGQESVCMSEHGPASTSAFSSVGGQPVEQQQASKTEHTLTQARQQVSQTGDYLARNVVHYPFQALFTAGLIGYGLGFLVHRNWASEPWQHTSAPEGHSGDVLRPIEHGE